ncbi:toprim domain-containing protein [Vibrio owensii]|uniref:toprim domain-containing protein n=1 Tax=Vibrio owensii TaxID=696485 RepID=UPI0018F19782|nr:toprim domain-containing protein [Vibrio owensii]
MTSQRLLRERQAVDALIAQVGWLNILKSLTPLTRAIDNYSGGKGKQNEVDVAPCHDSKSGKKFFLVDDAEQSGAGYCRVCGKVSDPYAIISGFNGGGFKEAYEQVKRLVGYDDKDVDQSYVKPIARPQYVERPLSKRELEAHARQRKLMAKLWEDAYEINDPRSKLAVDYMVNRGMVKIPDAVASIGFHPSVPYHQVIEVPSRTPEESPEEWEEYNQLIRDCQSSPYFNKFYYKDKMITGADMGNHPCILLLLRAADFEPRRVLKHYLNRDGYKLDLPSNQAFSVKKVCFSQGEDSKLTGAACYLDEPTQLLMAGEGFETVGVVRSYVDDVPAATTFNSSGLGTLEIPEGVEIVFSLVDKDRSKAGDKATLKLMKRCLEKNVLVIPVNIIRDIPEGEKGIDWADVLNSPGGEQELPPYLLNPYLDWNWELIFTDFYNDLLDQESKNWK